MFSYLHIRVRAAARRIARDETGASALEYGLIAGLVAVVLVGALTLTGTSLTSLFDSIASELSDAASSSSSSSSS